MPTKGFLGADLVQDGEFIRVKSVRARTPVYEQGLNANDRIIALDDQRVDKETFEALIAAKHAGDSIRLTIFRFDDLRTLDIRVSGRIDAPYRIVPLPNAGAEQKRIYQAWMGGTH